MKGHCQKITDIHEVTETTLILGTIQKLTNHSLQNDNDFEFHLQRKRYGGTAILH